MRGESLVAFLQDQRVRKFAFKTKYFSGKNVDFASEFDVFSALGDSVLLFAGHPIRAELLSVIAGALSGSVAPMKLSFAEYRKDVWQRIFYEDAETGCLNGFSEDRFNIDFADQFVYENSIDIRDLVDMSCDGTFGALERALDQISLQNVKILTFDVRDIIYERPDDYHAERSYLNMKQGMRGDVFLLWLLCRILMKKELKLRLVVNSAKDVQQILSLLSSVKLLPKICICVDILAQNEYQGFVDLMLDNYKKNISLEPSFSKEIDSNILFVNLKNLFCTVPFAYMSITLECAGVFCEAFDSIFEDDLSKSEIEALISSLRRVKQKLHQDL